MLECFSNSESSTPVWLESKSYKMENIDVMFVSERNTNEKEKGHGLGFDAK